MIKMSAIAVITLAMACNAHAQVQVSPSVVACGASTVSNGGVMIYATIAQSTAVSVTSSPVTISSGYWPQIQRCPADFGGDGTVTVQDIFDFLNAWFAGAVIADFNRDGNLQVQDIFDFLAAWFVGC